MQEKELNLYVKSQAKALSQLGKERKKDDREVKEVNMHVQIYLGLGLSFSSYDDTQRENLHNGRSSSLKIL